MKTKNLSELTNEELLKNEKILKVATYTLACVLLVSFITNLLLTMKKGFSALHVVPIALLPIVIVNLNTLKGIKKNWNPEVYLNSSLDNTNF